MNKISKIKITKANKTIRKGFEIDLKQMTVITGENNSGKTNFVESINNKKQTEFFNEKDEKLDPEIIYIEAKNINPSDNECKTSAKTTNLIKNLSKLFSNLEIKFELIDKDKIIKLLEDLEEKTNKNLEDFTGSSEHKLEITPNNDELNAEIIIQSLIEGITGCENEDERKLDDLGQGTQRIIIASILKAYIDILIEKKIHTEKPILIIFEEPEIYLHPKLKRSLNSTLEKISEQDNHQVIITTHDSYFVFPNFDDNNKKIHSFEKNDAGETNISGNDIINGIEDELLFIFLYSKLTKDEINGIEIGGMKGRVYKDGDNEEHKNCCNLDNIRHQIHHSGDNANTFKCGVSKKDDVPSGMNYYTQEELSESIRKMSEKIGVRKV